MIHTSRSRGRQSAPSPGRRSAPTDVGCSCPTADPMDSRSQFGVREPWTLPVIPRVVRFLGGVALALALLAGPLASSLFAAPAPTFRHVTIDDQVSIGYGVAIADVDGDRRLDIVLADKRVIAWYQAPDWKRHVIAEGLTELDNVCVAARDLDGDGKAEIAAGAGWNPGDTIGSGALFYLKPPEDRTQRWEPIRLAHDPTIHRIRWIRNQAGAFDLISVPLLGRGNRNGYGDGVRVLAYHRPSDLNAPWTTTELNRAWHATHNFDVLPDGTAGVGEMLRVASREGVFDLRPASALETGSWKVETIASRVAGTPEFIGAGEVRSGRGPGGSPLVATIEPMHGNQVVVYRPDPKGAEALWRRTVLDGTLVDGHGIACADVLGRGHDQVIAGWRAMTGPGKAVGIRLYAPVDDAATRWETHVIDDNQMACEDLQVADLDSDGDLDLVASGRATRNLKIYFNETARP